MNDLDLDLTGAADTFDLPAGDVQTVMARARTRAQRRQRIVAGTAALALVATSVAGLRLIAGGEPTTSVAAGGMAVRLGDDALAWETVEGTSVLSLLQQNPATASASGRLYALSTAPGQADLGQPLPKVVWQSDDGVDWSAAPLSDDIFLADLAASDQRIYAVGTGPATAAVTDDGAVPDLVVGWSDDGAGSWQTATLPIDMSAIAEASRSVAINPEELAIASSPGATVAVASITADLDVPRFLPDGTSAPNGWAVTPEGVDLLGPASHCPEGTSEEVPDGPPGRLWGVSCMGGDGEVRTLSPQEGRGVTASFTWNDLGVDGDLQRAALGQPMAFVAPAGSTEFTTVDLGLDGLGGFGLSLHADDEGFLLVSPSALTEDEEVTVLSSSDGRSWSAPADLPGGLDSIRSAGRVGDTFVVLGQSAQDGAMVVTDDGSGWQAVSVADLLGTEDDGTQVGLSMATIEAQGALAVVSTYQEGAEGVDHLVLTSSDAVTWSAQSVSELVDEPVSTIGQPVISGDQVVLPVAPIRPRGPDGHLEQVALVATLP